MFILFYQDTSASPLPSANLFPKIRAQSTIHHTNANKVINVLTPRNFNLIASVFWLSDPKYVNGHALQQPHPNNNFNKPTII
ncbi:unnamed protein product [Adineta steineri]|uniref:Uncharacterized protein n=1 Tax=Adineta steineri TaxID=433720 RepID=A0A814J293_9BILA|nr:unnamed protein product [Adineta steineri]